MNCDVAANAGVVRFLYKCPIVCALRTTVCPLRKVISSWDTTVTCKSSLFWNEHEQWNNSEMNCKVQVLVQPWQFRNTSIRNTNSLFFLKQHFNWWARLEILHHLRFFIAYIDFNGRDFKFLLLYSRLMSFFVFLASKSSWILFDWILHHLLSLP